MVVRRNVLLRRQQQQQQQQQGPLKIWIMIMMMMMMVSLLANDCNWMVTATMRTRSRMVIPSSMSRNLSKIRGGGGETSSSSKRRRKKKKRKRSSNNDGDDEEKELPILDDTTIDTNISSKEGRDIWNQAMRKDPAKALGDAIRERADTLRADPISMLPHYDARTYRFDASLQSLGTALGCSTANTAAVSKTKEKYGNRNSMSGGVEVSSSAVLAQYFLQSHGGAHGIQCLASFSAVLYGTLSILLYSPTNQQSTLVLVRRCLLSAMAKHFSGLFAAALLSAQRIPRVGLRNTKALIHNTISTDAVSQYLFYCALWILWLNNNKNYTVSKFFITCLIGPIWIREAVSTALVLSDILVLLCNASSQSLPTWYKFITYKLLDKIIMPLVIGKKKWSRANQNNHNSFATKQILLAEWVGKCSYGMEIVTFIFMTKQAIQSCQQLLLGTANTNNNNNNNQPEKTISLFTTVIQLFCTRLYMHYLWNIKKWNITKSTKNMTITPTTTTTSTASNTEQSALNTKKDTSKSKKRKKRKAK